MNFVRFCAGIVLIAALTGCVEPAQSVSDVHTGVNAGMSKEYVASQAFGSRVLARAVVATKGAETKYGIAIQRYGLGWAFYNSAFSFGAQLPYEAGSRSMGACSPIGCDTVERGLISLTPAQFQTAQKSGMEIRLVGQNDSVVIQVPAAAFNEALSLKK